MVFKGNLSQRLTKYDGDIKEHSNTKRDNSSLSMPRGTNNVLNGIIFKGAISSFLHPEGSEYFIIDNDSEIYITAVDVSPIEFFIANGFSNLSS